jgi:2,3-bisphosphoglycerate-independent phosphoglycerate mutase
MLFLDGVGIGVKDPSVNPLFAANMPALRSLFEGELPSLGRRLIRSERVCVVPLDATLGLPGLPQSGTGQTSLFTGTNGAALAGKHFGPHPYSSLKPVIQERNIFRRLRDAGRSPLFANAFPQRFFEYISGGRARMTVTTLSCIMSGVPLLRSGDLARGKAVSADITNEGWGALGYPDIPVIKAAEAGEHLCGLVLEHDFVLFEYWKTDKAGHNMSAREAISVLETFDAMLGGILRSLEAEGTLLVITSDHGNVEDLTVKTHTRHPVPFILVGAGATALANRLTQGADLTSVTPLLLDYLGVAA